MRPSTQASADPGASVPMDPPDPSVQVDPAAGLQGEPVRMHRRPRSPAIRAYRQARCERAGTSIVLTRETGALEVAPPPLILRATDGRTVHTESLPHHDHDHELLLLHPQGRRRHDAEDHSPRLGGIPTHDGGAPSGHGGGPQLRRPAPQGRLPGLGPRGEPPAGNDRREPRDLPEHQQRDRRVHRTPEDAAPAGGLSPGRRTPAPIASREEPPVPSRPVARGSVRTAGTKPWPASGRGTPRVTTPRRSPVFRGLISWEAGSRA